ncbi:hypothetical protein [Methylobacterium fujisawaense]
MADSTVVASRLAAAQAQTRRATVKVRRASAAHLTGLLRLSPTERIGHLDDTELVTTDRAALRRSIQASAFQVNFSRARHRVRLWPRGARGRRLIAGFARALLTPEIALLPLLVAIWLGFAWNRTAHIATFTRDVPILRAGPDGRMHRVVLPRGGSVIVHRGWDGTLSARRWLPGWGYESVPLAPNTIVWGWPDEIRPSR